MATSKPKKDTPTCKHQWMTVMGDDPYTTKKICIKCGAEKKEGGD